MGRRQGAGGGAPITASPDVGELPVGENDDAPESPDPGTAVTLPPSVPPIRCSVPSPGVPPPGRGLADLGEAATPLGRSSRPLEGSSRREDPI